MKFILYWKDGKSEVAEGESISDAFSKSGYGNGAIAALDFFEGGEKAKYSWVNGKWEKIFLNKNEGHRSHYDYLEKYFEKFFVLVTQTVTTAPYTYTKDIIEGLISAHGDKCYSYRDEWKDKGIPFEHGVAIYLLSFIQPYSENVRRTRSYPPEGGHIDSWVAPDEWVIANYKMFKPFLIQSEQIN